MKNILTILAITISASTFSQTILHVKGQKAVQVNIGGTKYSHWKRYEAGFNMFTSDKGYWDLSLSLDRGKVNLTDYQDYLFTGRYGRILWKPFYGMFINISGGLTAGFQTTTNITTGDLPTKFIYGVLLGPEIEYYPIGKLGIKLHFLEPLMFGGSFGNEKTYYLQYNYGIGLKYIIN